MAGTERVWCPDKSLPTSAEEAARRLLEGKRKKGRSRFIQRRTQPTVDLSVLETQRRVGEAEEEEGAGYRTIEKSTYRKNGAGLESGSGRRTAELSGGYCADFCGWETEGTSSSALSQNNTASVLPTFKRNTYDRSLLATPADGWRGGGVGSRGASRACSRAGVRGRNCYVFQHFSNHQDHLQAYLNRCCYTNLNVPRNNSNLCACAGDGESNKYEEVCTREEQQQKQGTQESDERGEDGGRKDSENVRRIRNESIGKQEMVDSCKNHLQRLAKRLGVRDSILLPPAHPRPTPPSIARGKKGAPADADLLVCSKEEKSNTEEEAEDEEIFPADTQRKESCKDSEMTTGLELPRILAKVRVKNNKTLSTTSVCKYLHISSGTEEHSLPLPLHLPPGVGEEECGGDEGSDISIVPTRRGKDDVIKISRPVGEEEVAKTLSELSSRTENKANSGQGGKDILSKGYKNSSNAHTQPTTPFSGISRNRVLAQKAQALGLLSRDWARVGSTRDAMDSTKNGESSYVTYSTSSTTSRPTTTHRHRQQKVSITRPHTRESGSLVTTASTFRNRGRERGGGGRSSRIGGDSREGNRGGGAGGGGGEGRGGGGEGVRGENCSYRHSLPPSSSPISRQEVSNNNKEVSEKKSSLPSSSSAPSDRLKMKKLKSIYETADLSSSGRQRGERKMSDERTESQRSTRRSGYVPGSGGKKVSVRGNSRTTAASHHHHHHHSTKFKTISEIDGSQYWTEVTDVKKSDSAPFQIQIRNGIESTIKTPSTTNTPPSAEYIAQGFIPIPPELESRHTQVPMRSQSSHQHRPPLFTGISRTSRNALRRSLSTSLHVHPHNHTHHYSHKHHHHTQHHIQLQQTHS